VDLSVFYTPRYTAFVMPKASKLQLMPLPPSDETPGRRLARIRRERGFTQIELAEKPEWCRRLFPTMSAASCASMPI
jgi:hypothetical protein